MGIFKIQKEFLDPNQSKMKMRGFIVIIYTVIVFLSEIFFRNPLFEESEKVEIYFQKNINLSFFKIISDIGTIPTFFPIMIITYLLLPLNIPFSLFSVIIHASYWDNILKILYGEARPYWVFRELIPSCNGGFGNPSGHSMSSSAVYLSIWHILTSIEYFKNKILQQIILLVLFSFFILLILFSRLVLAAHSLNQVLFGGLLGISIYLFHYYVFEMEKMKSTEFFELFRSKTKKISFGIFYFVLFLISIVFYFSIKNTKIIEQNIDYINMNCKRIEDYRKFNEDGLFNSLSIFGLIGAHLGLVYFTHYLEKRNILFRYEEIYQFNQTNMKNKLFILLILLGCAFPIIIFFVLSGTMELILVYIFKIIIPYLFGGFGLFGFGLYLIIQYKFCNGIIFEDQNNDLLDSRLSI